MPRQVLTTAAVLLLFTACASGPEFETEGVNQGVTPRQAVEAIDAARGDQVVWGGMIVDSTHLEDATRFEILGYPLTGSQQPDLEAQPTGRFLAVREGYVETVDYGQGRLLTIKGEITGAREGRIDEADYTYPVVDADQMYLWPVERPGGGRSGINFGFGVGIIFTN